MVAVGSVVTSATAVRVGVTWLELWAERAPKSVTGCHVCEMSVNASASEESNSPTGSGGVPAATGLQYRWTIGIRCIRSALIWASFGATSMIRSPGCPSRARVEQHIRRHRRDELLDV